MPSSDSNRAEDHKVSLARRRRISEGGSEKNKKYKEDTSSKYFLAQDATYTMALNTQESSSSAVELQSLAAEKKEDVADERGEAAPPDTAVEALQTWHSPRMNMFRVFATFWSFFAVGMNDGSYGVSPPPSLQNLVIITDILRLWFHV